MLGFLKNLVTSPKPADTQIWETDLLVIEHPQDGIVYAQRTEVEFEPDPQAVRIGHLKALSALDGWQPSLNVRQRFDLFESADPRLRFRGGLTLFGQDGEGHDFTWYFAAAADQYLIDKERCEISYPCLPTISEEDLARLNADRLDDSETETWLCHPLVIIDDEGAIAYNGEASIVYTPVYSGIRSAWVQANFVTEDGWQPAMHAVLSKRKGRYKLGEAPNWTFRGYDREGLPFTWLIGTAAKEELIRREDHLMPNEPA